MTPPSLRRIVLADGVGGPPALRTQTFAPKPAEAGAPSMLSPFVLDRPQHGGDQSASTLSGRRLESDRKAVTASAAVLTAGFLCDRGATALAGAEDDSATDCTGLSGLKPGDIDGDFGDASSRHNRVPVRGQGAASTTVNFIDPLVSPDRCTTARRGVPPWGQLGSAQSASPARLINSSMERVFMSPGQSAATAAGVALDKNTGVQDVSHPPLRGRLLAGKPILSP